VSLPATRRFLGRVEHQHSFLRNLPIDDVLRQSAVARLNEAQDEGSGRWVRRERKSGVHNMYAAVRYEQYVTGKPSGRAMAARPILRGTLPQQTTTYSRPSSGATSKSTSISLQRGSMPPSTEALLG
jgi:hypothetical protein